MWKWLIIVLSVFLVNIGKSIAQSSISAKITGTVTDGLTDVPVEFVTVYLKGSSNAVETDASGRYNINVPAQKVFVLVFTRIGYKESVVNADAMPNGSSRHLQSRITRLMDYRASCAAPAGAGTAAPASTVA